jgi:hypothetical protein
MKRVGLILLGIPGRGRAWGDTWGYSAGRDRKVGTCRPVRSVRGSSTNDNEKPQGWRASLALLLQRGLRHSRRPARQRCRRVTLGPDYGI